jgi:hypothetical protein
VVVVVLDVVTVVLVVDDVVVGSVVVVVASVVVVVEEVVASVVVVVASVVDVVELVVASVVVVVAIVVEVVLVVAPVVVVVGAVVLVVRHRQSSPHSGPNRRPGAGGHCSGLRLHGGSHSSPGSSRPLPHGLVVVVVVEMVVVVVLTTGQGFGSQLPGPASWPPASAHSAAVSCWHSSSAPPGELATQHWVSSGRVVVVVTVTVVVGPVLLVLDVVVVVVVVTSAQGSGSQVPSPTRTPRSRSHSAGFRSSQVKAPPGEVGSGGMQHWVSCSTCAGEQPRSTASHQLANAVSHAVPPRRGWHLLAWTTAHLVRPRRLVLQHVTLPGRPQVDRSAHFITMCICFLESRPAATCAFTAWLTHRI